MATSSSSNSSSKPKRGKVNLKSIAGGIAARALHPKHLWQAAKLQKARKANRKAFDDARLALYAKILPSDFLHFGYFDDTTRRPEDISLAELAAAQTRYAELLLELADQDKSAPVLDVGCGMGGLTRMLRDRGYTPTALTPDRLQVSHVQSTLPGVTVIRSKFEDLPAADHAHRYGTVFTSESLQYLDLDRALPLMAAILKPGGKWVACDFFHARPTEEKTLHQWDDFAARLPAAGWRITYERDITAHIRPTLAYIHMWATRFGLPLMHFVFLRLQRKQPALHHLLTGALGQLEAVAEKNIEVIDPDKFTAGRRYVLMTLERA